MLIIEKDTENRLYKELRDGWDTYSMHKCLYLRLSQFERQEEKWLPDFIKSLKNLINDDKCRVYVCNDKDIFILSRYITRKTSDRFLSLISNIFDPLNVYNLSSLYEVGIDWPRLRTICEKKIENKNILKERADIVPKIEEKQLSWKELIKKINNDLIYSLSERRKNRDHVEIMIVEDDHFSQRLVGNAIGKKYPYSITGDGRGAVLEYVNKAPDVLFLDIGLPDVSGHEILEEIFKIDPNAYVVMFSGMGDRNNIVKAINLGAKGFVAKPFTRKSLFQYIDKSPFIQNKEKKEIYNGYIN